MLLAGSIDIKVLDALGGKSASVRAGHFMVVYVDDRESLKSEMKPGDPPPQWRERCQFRFEPSSKIQISIFRRSRLPLKKHLVGQYIGNGIELLHINEKFVLTDATGAIIGSHIAVKLDLNRELPEEFMKSVDADMSHLDIRTEAAQTLGACAKPLGQALQLIAGFMDNVANSHPILSVSWTVLSSVYKAVRNQMDMDDAARVLAENLREMVGMAHQFRDVLLIEGTDNVIDKIGRLTLEVAYLIHEYAKLPLLGRTAKFQLLDDMKARIGKCQTDCNDLTVKLDRRVGADTNVDVKKIGNILKVIKDERKAEKIYKWLSAPDSSPNYHAAREKCHAETGSWFVMGAQFAEWREKPDRILWIYGAPGCGKTILCSSVVDNVATLCEADNRLLGYAYFFFDSRNSQNELSLHEKFIRSLILQFSDQCGGIPAPLDELHGNGHQQPSIGSLHSTLNRIMEGFEHAYILIDSLDECAERMKLLNWIEEMVRSKQGRLHLLVTSRQERDIEDHLNVIVGPGRVALTGNSANGDIEAYLDARLSNFKKWDQETRDNIKETLMQGANGMFRWVALQLEELITCSSRRDVKNQLQAMPKDLGGIYEKILSRSHKPDDLKRFLQLLAFAVRPMKIEEVAEVVVVNFVSNEGPSYDADLRYVDPKDVLTVCSGLITEFEGTVKLAHMSVKEYLTSDHILSGSAAHFSISEHICHCFIAETCLAYLLHFGAVDSITDGRIGSFLLARYAAAHWIVHVRSVGGDAAPTLQALISNLLRSDSAAFTNWFRIYDPDSPSQGPDMSRRYIATPIYYASLAGLSQAVQTLVASGADVNAVGGSYSNALRAASAKGHYATAKILLEAGADANAWAGKYGNTLQRASEGGHDRIVKILLEAGANVNAKVGFYGNPLQTASQAGQDGIVEMLLEAGANVNAQGGYYSNALAAASCSGCNAIVKMLLEVGADVNAQGPADVSAHGGHYGNALAGASARGHDVIVKTLLEAGADINAQRGWYGYALQAASAGGHDATVKTLLDAGADINAQGGHHGNALQAASHSNYGAVVKMLLKEGADANAQGGDHSNALVAASLNGHDAIVKMLLEAGADANVEVGGARNALQAASARGHDAIVKVLLEAGADVNVQEGHYESALAGASAGGHHTIVKMLLEAGADVNTQQGRYANALAAASAGGHNEIVKMLLEAGSNVNAPVGYYGNALQAASQRGHNATVKILLEARADVNAQGGHYSNALQAAAEKGHDATVKMLLEVGADVNAQGGHYGNALQAAAEKGRDATMKILLKAGADVNAQGGQYGNALQAKSVQGHDATVKMLLEVGANVNTQGGYYGSALAGASVGGHNATVKMLLEAGADVNAQGGYHGSALAGALVGGHNATVKMLLEAEADVNVQGGYYGNALQAASQRGHDATVKMLLEAGADVNVQGGHYGNALLAASERGHGVTMKMLLEAGADVNTQGGFYGNALQAESQRGHDATVKTLLEAGADANAQGGYYGNALQAASEQGHDETVKMLLEAGGDVNAQGGFYGNALKAASQRGYKHIMELLASHGAVDNEAEAG